MSVGPMTRRIGSFFVAPRRESNWSSRALAARGVPTNPGAMRFTRICASSNAGLRDHGERRDHPRLSVRPATAWPPSMQPMKMSVPAGRITVADAGDLER